MPSPFPGMDPYLEETALWAGVHGQLTTYISAQLAPKLRPKYVPYTETRIEIGLVDLDAPRPYLPDIAVAAHAVRAAGTPAPPGITAPLEIETVVEWEMTIATVNILRAADQRLVAVIEILSPINKRPGNEAYEAYRRKRTTLLQSDIHLLEIDLLRQGRRVLPQEALPPAPYFVFLSRADRRSRCEVWPIALADPLPVVPVPLLAPDPDAPLDLGAALSTLYDAHGYDLILDYTLSPPGPLTGHDLEWVGERLRAQGARR
ncbi:MAG: DUF4058 family protein [Anaerolineae bacterium]|nr:DUF4058 family protein [Anaerolineae bacterium]